MFQLRSPDITDLRNIVSNAKSTDSVLALPVVILNRRECYLTLGSAPETAWQVARVQGTAKRRPGYIKPSYIKYIGEAWVYTRHGNRVAQSLVQSTSESGRLTVLVNAYAAAAPMGVLAWIKARLVRQIKFAGPNACSAQSGRFHSLVPGSGTSRFDRRLSATTQTVPDAFWPVPCPEVSRRQIMYQQALESRSSTGISRVQPSRYVLARTLHGLSVTTALIPA